MSNLAVTDRFWSKVAQSGKSECWPWLAYRKANGYGTFYLKGRTCLAHRVAYELEVGPIPHGLVIDHRCRNRSCVNPTHLEPVTHRVNILRGQSPSARFSGVTECIHGHEFTPDNTYVRKDGKGRMCKTCRRIGMRK